MFKTHPHIPVFVFPVSSMFCFLHPVTQEEAMAIMLCRLFSRPEKFRVRRGDNKR